MVLVGEISCNSRLFEYGCAGGKGSAFAVAPNGGIEFRLSEHWSNAAEMMYWMPLGVSTEPRTDYNRPRLTLGVTVRYLFSRPQK